MDAGLKLFGTDGYRATSIEKLCAAAGVSTRNFYEEFTGRESLLIAVYDQAMESALAAAMKSVEAAGDTRASFRIDDSVRAFIADIFADPRTARIAFVEVLGVGPDVEARRMAWREQGYANFRARAADMVARGEAVDRDYTLTAVAHVGAFNELVYGWALRGTPIPIDAVVAELALLAKAAMTTPWAEENA